MTVELRDPTRIQPLRLPLAPGWILLVLVLVAYPLVATSFWTMQIGAQALILGTVALSLMFLGGYGGMVSMAQMTVAGLAGYFLAMLGGANGGLGLGWPWWIALPGAVVGATAVATLIGILSVRTEGIYTIMITLAIAVATFYFAQQNWTIFNGFNGFAGLAPPALFGLDWRAPLPFYYLSLAIAAGAFAAVTYLARSTFGLTVQAIRDNPRRMRALGYDVTLHRVAAYALAGFIAALGGVLSLWYNGRISPGSIAIGPVINILIIAVIGGLNRPLGPFIGALLFVLLQNFAIDLIDRERFNLIIGGGFLIIVLASPDGLLGLWERARRSFQRSQSGVRNPQRHQR